MLVGYDSNGSRIHISEYKEGSEVFCPDGHLLIAKRGDVRVHHFSHKSNCNCRFACNKTDWHQKFQDRADKKNQEVRMEKDGKLHIADVQIGRFVIEYQHSNIATSDIHERESFYTSLGYTLVWVFDTSNWDYQVLQRKDKEVTIVKRRGSDFPMNGAYTSPVMKILDFNKRELLIVTSQKGSKVTGTLINMMEFDKMFMDRENDDIRPFHHPL